jgi:hypothetical protein
MMTIYRVVVFTGLCVATLSTNAGTLKKTAWESNNCGTKPLAPALNYDSVEEFNDSIATMNAWQRETVAYFECVGKEANADIKKITDTLGAQQKEFETYVEKNNADAAEVKQKVESENALPAQ